jgi:serine/threonine-protein kinase
MAPEQWQGKTSAATDQYALGVVLYELITGRKPYSADTPAAIILMQATEPLAPPSKIVSGIPERVEKVLYKALARDPQDRYDNMDEFTNALRGLLAEADTAEPVLHQKETRILEAAPAAQVSSANEGITQDALDATPVEEMDVAPKNKRGLPKWALWAGIGVLGLIIIGVVIGLGGNPVTVEKESTESLAILAVETGTATILPGATKTTTPIKTASITPTPEPTLGIGSTMINEKDGAEMVYVPAGEFTMGSENMEAYSDEAPEHTVYLDAYWIYKYEVANTQYRQCIEDGACSGDLSQYPENNFPAVYINWNEATDYCAWAGGRLPTEAEWEKAARGEYGRTYPWGEASPKCSLAQYYGCSGETIPVGSLHAGASPYGALDMAGNVLEWVADWYDADYYRNSPAQNPTGLASGTYRVLRGGAWYNNEGSLRASARNGFDPDISYDVVGFRCLSSVAP